MFIYPRDIHIPLGLKRKGRRKVGKKEKGRQTDIHVNNSYVTLLKQLILEKTCYSNRLHISVSYSVLNTSLIILLRPMK